MKLLLDEMWSPVVAEALRRRGHDVVAVAARRDLRSASDETVVEAARAEGRVIVTEDVDYRSLMAVAVRDERDFPPFILTSSRRWPRSNPGAVGRLVEALDALLVADDALDGEYWL